MRILSKNEILKCEFLDKLRIFAPVCRASCDLGSFREAEKKVLLARRQIVLKKLLLCSCRTRAHLTVICGSLEAKSWCCSGAAAASGITVVVASLTL